MRGCHAQRYWLDLNPGLKNLQDITELDIRHENPLFRHDLYQPFRFQAVDGFTDRRTA
jgi:hypothetical protein